MGKSLKEILKESPEFDEGILRAAENGDLVFFIGAGVSRIMGVKGWDDLSKTLVKSAYPNYADYETIIRDVPNSKERITIAYKKFEEQERLKEFYDILGKALTPDIETFKKKRNIYQILNRFNATFLTTNADNLFEEVIGTAVCHEECEAYMIKDELLKRQNHLFYLHGHYTDKIDVKNNNLVFTVKQYIERYNDKHFIEFLRYIFDKKKVVIFIGYGLNEFELMDYVITKVNYTKTSDQRVHVLYGFCENDEILYQAKKTYFEALNINLIPYDMTKIGFDALIDVLENLLEKYNLKTVVPMTEVLSKSLSEFTPGNYAYILGQLKDITLAQRRESQIVAEILKTKTLDWVKSFYSDGLFSSVHLSERLEMHTWPLLELFLVWVNSEDNSAQDAATQFLDQITAEQREKLSSTYSFINVNIAEIILALDKSHIRSKYIDLLKCVTSKSYSIYFMIERTKTMSRMVAWDIRIVRKLFNFLFEQADVNSYHDSQSYAIQQFFKRFNKESSGNTRISGCVFEYFVNMLQVLNRGRRSLFLYINSLDNIYKNHQDYWKLIMTEIKFAFQQLDKKVQHTALKGLFAADNEACWKLALYLARKYDHNVGLNIERNANILSSKCSFHELFLLLVHHTENAYLRKSEISNLSMLIRSTNFGYDEQYIKQDPIFFEKLILSKRLLLLQTLNNNEDEQEIQRIIEQGIIPYDSIDVAEQCDYVHSETWVNDIQITQDMFDSIDSKKWNYVLGEKCKSVTDQFTLGDCARQYVKILLEKNEEEINNVLFSLRDIQSLLLQSIIIELRAKYNELPNTEILIDAGLNILQELSKEEEVDKDLAKELFALLARVEPMSEDRVLRILKDIRPWLDISVGETDVLTCENELLTNLINYGDFEKYSVLLNCYVWLRKNRNQELSDDEMHLLLNLLANDTSKKVFRYTLCYNYQNLKYIAKSKFEILEKALLEDGNCDIDSLLLCILNSSIVFSELTKIIREMFLIGNATIPDECRDGIMTKRLFEYIIASKYYGYLSQADMLKAYENQEFVEFFLHSISAWANKENFVLDDWIVPCWEQIKQSGEEMIIQQNAEALLHSIDDVNVPTEKLLSTYLEVAEYCKRCSSFIIKISKVLVFFEVNIDKTIRLLNILLEKNDYLMETELEIIIQRCAEVDCTEKAKILLNKLFNNGKISLETRDKMARLLI